MPRRRPSGRLIPGLFVGSLLILAAIAVSLASVRAATTPPSPVLADPHLILHPRTTHVHRVIAGGRAITVSLYPTLPGMNTVQLVWQRTGSNPSSISLTADMRGMRMVPPRAMLILHGGVFSGRISLPMFGSYRLTVTARTRHSLQRASFGIELRLPRT